MIIPLNLPPGFFTESSERGSVNRWRGGTNIRFYQGKPQTIGGWVSRRLDARLDIMGIVRGVAQWQTIAGSKYAVFGGTGGFFVLDDDRVYNVTPVIAEYAVSDLPVSIGVGDNRFNISNASGINVVAGDYVTLDVSDRTGLSEAVIFNVESYINDRLRLGRGFNAYMQPVDVNVGGSFTVSNISVLLGVGTSSTERGKGWGVGGWGEEGWGTPRTVTDEDEIFLPASTYSLQSWGEDLLVNRRGGSLYHLDMSSFSESSRLKREEKKAGQNGLAESPVKVNSFLVSSQERRVITYGCTEPTQYGGNFDPMLIRWCSAGDFTDWDIESDDGTAGAKRLDNGNEIVCAVPARQEIVIFTDTGVSTMSHIGGDLIYQFGDVSDSCSILSPNAAIEYGGVVYAMCYGDFFVYSGSLRPLPCEIKTFVYENLNYDQIEKVYCGLNTEFTEIWWFCPSKNSEENDFYVVYNVAGQFWYYGQDFERTCWIDRGVTFRRPLALDASNTIYDHETGYTADGQGLEFRLESFALEIAEGESIVHVSKIIPDIIGEPLGQADITLMPSLYPSQPKPTKSRSFDFGDKYISIRARGRQVSLGIEGRLNPSTSAPFRCDSWRLDIMEDGKR